MLKKYLQAARDASKDFLLNWKVLIAIFPLLFFNLLIIPRIASFGGLIGGLIAGLLQIALFTYYYTWVKNSSHKRALDFKEIFDFNSAMFFAILNVAFVFFIASFIISSFHVPGSSPFFILAFNLIVVIIFNPIPEIIYRYLPQNMQAFPESIEFIKKNWLEWLLPVVLFSLPLLLIKPEIFPVVLAQASVLLPADIVMRSWSILGGDILFTIFIVILGHWYMLFRSRLFVSLD